MTKSGCFFTEYFSRWDLQYDGVVKANVRECPVHYHHVGVKDLPSQLQQAEHGTPMKLCNGRGGTAE